MGAPAIYGGERFIETRRMEETLAEREDRISELPDSIVGHILSLLCSTREAIRTSVLSKRWQYLWTSIPTLIISESERYRYSYNGAFFSSVGRTLARRGHNKLQKFGFLTERCWYIEQHNSHINQWISYAIRCNVEEVIIRGFPLKYGALSKLPGHLFRSSCLKKLSLDHCDFEPIGEINWKNLKSLRVSYGRLTCRSISKLLSGSPSLETLELRVVYGSDTLNISSTSLRKLIVHSQFSSNGIEIDEFKITAPNILSLEIKGNITSKIMLVDVGSVVEATLDFKVPPFTGMGKVTLKRIMQSLIHVNELKIGVNCFEDLMYVEMKTWPSPISMCKYLQINVLKDGDSPRQEIKRMTSNPALVFMNERASIFTRPNNAIIWFVLEYASVLEKIVICASPECVAEAELLQSVMKLEKFHRTSKEKLVVVLETLK